MDEVLKFSCGLSSEAARAVLSHLRIIGEKEGLTELSEIPYVEDLSDDQRVFRRISLDCLLSCPALDRQAVCPLYFHAVNNILVIDTDSQLTLVARDLVLRFSILPESCYLLFPKKFDNRDKLFSILKDLETVLITCYGETMGVPDDFDSVALGDASWFLKREGQQMMFCFSLINVTSEGFNLLRALTSAPESSPEKRVDHLLQSQDNSEALHSTENTSVATVNHSLSFTRNFKFWCTTTEELTTACNVLCFVKRPRIISIVDMRCDLGELSWTYLHEGWNDSVSENLCHFKEVTELKLLGVGLECEGGQLLATAISHLCQLRKLDLSVNPLGQSVIGLAKHLPSLPHLIELHLRITLMGKEEVIALARSLPSISKLEKLDLSDNPLGQGVIELAQYLTSVPHLTELHLSHTQMGEEEVGAVVRALKYVCELEVLHLADNPLGRGVSELIQHLSSVPQLRCLYLWDVKMTKKEASELCTAVPGTNISKLLSDYAFHSGRDGELTRCTWAVYDDSEEAGGGDLALAGSPGSS